MKRPPALTVSTLAVLFVALLLLSGCILLGQTAEMSRSAVTVLDTPSVTLDTFSGNIEVSTGPDGRVSADITKAAADDADWDRIEFNFSQTNTQVTGRCTWTGEGSASNAACNLDVQVPAGSDVEIMTGNGSVIYTAIPGRTLNIVSSNGNVEVTLPPDAQFTLRAATGNGEVQNGFALADSTVAEAMRVIGTVGAAPTLDIMLGTANGNITLTQAQ